MSGNAFRDIGQPKLAYPFGGEAAFRNVQGFQQQFGRPLLFGFGLGAGPRAERFQEQLQSGEFGGPLAPLIRQGQQFIPTLFPAAQRVGSDIAARAPAAFDQLRAQIQAGLQGTGQALEGAQQFASQALAPTRESAIFQRASNRLLEGIRPGLAGRGLLEQGEGQAAEEAALRDLSLDFVSREADLQTQALQNLLNASGAGAGLAQAELGALPAFGNLLLSGQTLPLQALMSALGISQFGAQPALDIASFLQPLLGQLTMGQSTTPTKLK